MLLPLEFHSRLTFAFQSLLCCHSYTFIRPDKPSEVWSNFFGLPNVLRSGILQCFLWHFVPQSTLWILDYGDATAFLDRIQPCRTVVQESTQQDSDHTRTVFPRRRSKQRINGRAVAVLARASYDP